MPKSYKEKNRAKNAFYEDFSENFLAGFI